MHYRIIAVIDKPVGELTEEAITAAVDKVMEPFGDGREWDWYQIGGRYTGHFDGYDPKTDEAKKEACLFCEDGITTQAVADAYPAYQEHVGKTCIQCKGAAKRTSWPTCWGFRSGDVKPVSELTEEDMKAYGFCLIGYGWYAREEWVPWQTGESMFREKELPTLDWIKTTFDKQLAVVVDCHN